MSYYRRLVQDYGKILPLHDLLKKIPHWTPDHTLAFDKLKAAMSTCPVLALPNFSKPFVMETDACGTSIDVVLMQCSRPLAYFSKCLEQRTVARSVYQKEVIAILEALEKW
jgi:hypothetical protein